MISRESIRNGHPIKPLGEVVEFLDSRRRPITKKDRIPGPYPYYGANGQQDSVADFIFDEPLILLAEDGGLFDEPDRGIAYSIEGKTWVNNHAHVIRPRDGVCLDYLTRVLENYDVRPWINGSTRAKLTKAAASRIEVPLPPLAEQKRIAAILDAADGLRATRREALATLDTLLQSTFLDMFGDPVTNPKRWQTARLEELFKVEHGYAFKSEYFKQEGKYIVLTPGNFHESGGYRDQGSKTKYYSIEPPEKFILAKGDLLIAMTEQAPGLLGSPISVPADDRYLHNQRLGLLRFGNQVHPTFVYHLFNTAWVRGELQRSSTGTKVKHTSPTKIGSISVALPPLDLQNEFDAVVQSIKDQSLVGCAHLAELDTLFASLQSRAFRGEL